MPFAGLPIIRRTNQRPSEDYAVSIVGQLTDAADRRCYHAAGPALFHKGELMFRFLSTLALACAMSSVALAQSSPSPSGHAMKGNSMAGHAMKGNSMAGHSMKGSSMSGHSMKGSSMSGHSMKGASPTPH
jgi:pentapeptide MXKDX repeat protein